MQYYILYQGKQVGPMDKEFLVNYGLMPSTMVWHQGLPQWVPASQVPELMEMLNASAQTPPPFGASRSPRPGEWYDYADTGVTGKNRVAAGIFAILLGFLGVQYFYCGKVGGGFICILLSLVTCGLWEVVTLIQGILILTMTQEQFEQKYVLSPSVFPLF